MFRHEKICKKNPKNNTEIIPTQVNINEKILNNGVYITPLQVISDSRCSNDVLCVWAGEIRRIGSFKIRNEGARLTWCAQNLSP